MTIRSLLVVVAILLFASPVFSQFGQANNRLNDLAARLAREADEFAQENYTSYVNGTRNTRREIEAAMMSQQFAASARIFYRMVVDRRRNSDLRQAFEMVQNVGNSVNTFNLQRNRWNDLQRIMSDVSRELSLDSGGGQYPDTPGRGGRMTWKGRVDDDVRIRIRGGTAEVETVGGTPYYDSQPNFSNSLPNRRVTVRVNKTRGRGEVFIEQQPSRENDFTAVVRIRDSRGGAAEYEFELTW
jgi:hypothetical protein